MTGIVIQRRRGTTTQHATVVGPEGEMTVDTTKHTVVVHDGATPGGFPLSREGHAHASFGGATSVAPGAVGFVPAPAAGAQGRFLRGDGVWSDLGSTTDTVSEATNKYFTQARARAALSSGNGISYNPSTGEIAVAGSSVVTSVAGMSGDVTLSKTNVGLSNVDNTSDASKPVSTATAAAIASLNSSLMTFDGEAATIAATIPSSVVLLVVFVGIAGYTKRFVRWTSGAVDLTTAGGVKWVAQNQILRVTTSPLQLTVADVGRLMIADLSSLGLIEIKLPAGSTLADGMPFHFLKDIRRAEGRLDVLPYPASGNTICSQTVWNFATDGRFGTLVWDAARSDFKLVGQGTSAFLNTRYEQEHTVTAASTIGSPYAFYWSENGSRELQCDTTSGNQVTRIEDIDKGALKTTTGAVFAVANASFRKVSSDLNTHTIWAPVGQTINRVPSSQAALVLEKFQQTKELVSFGTELIELPGHNPHRSHIQHAILSASTTDPDPAGALANQTSICLHPWQGDMVWVPLTTADGVNRVGAERHINAPLVRGLADATYGYVAQASAVHNVFLYQWLDGRLVLILGAANAGDGELAYFDGVLVNAAGLPGGAGVQANSAKWVGRILINASGTLDWAGRGNITLPTSAPSFGVWNAYNRRPVTLSWDDSGGNYNYNSTTWRKQRGGTGNFVRFIGGDRPVRALSSSYIVGGSGIAAFIGVGLNGDAPAAGGKLAYWNSPDPGIVEASFEGYPAAGVNTLAPIEKSAGGNPLFSGGASAGYQHFSFTGWM